MNVYIPSRGRSSTAFIHGAHSTLTWLKGTTLAQRTYYCVRSDEVMAYRRALGGTGVRVLDVGLTEHVSGKRAIVAEHARTVGEPKFLMADDDLRLYLRKSSNGFHLRYVGPGEAE